MKGSALAHGCGRGGRGALPLPRAAVISTRLRVLLADDGELLLAALLEAAEEVDEHAVHHLVTLRARTRARLKVRGGRASCASPR